MKRSSRINSTRVSDELLYDTILEMCAAAGPEKSVTPAAIARALDEFTWQSLLKRLRITAVKQAQAGLIYIMRKGKPADPNDFKGVYKLRLVPGVDVQAHLQDPEVNKGSGVKTEEKD
ncbi:MAG: DUF3253 domain-containing protein [Ardenticatenaceae bacterium]|nr:DUF3253 domain-containing protein [Ardenticatenaceae bacterium]